MKKNLKQSFAVLMALTLFIMSGAHVSADTTTTTTTSDTTTTTTTTSDSSSSSSSTLGPIEGTITLKYSASAGRISAAYNGSQDYTDPTYTWYRDGSSVSTTGASYYPTQAGVYTVKLKDKKYEGQISSSNSIALYQAKGTDVTFDNDYGLYEQGSTVTCVANLEPGQEVSNWRTSGRGIEIPQSGSVVSFKMPGYSITITPVIEGVYTVKITGGKADKFTAHEGEIVTITASTVPGKTFESWESSGASINNPEKKVTTFTMPSSNVVISVKYKDPNSSSDSSSSYGGTTYDPYNTGTSSTGTAVYDPVTGTYTYQPSTSTSTGGVTSGATSWNDKVADANTAVYYVIFDNGYKVSMYHHSQGPQCVAAFKANQGDWYLVSDYFNVVINGDTNIRQIPNPVKIQMVIPDDLKREARKWRMLCIGADGNAYSYDDTDISDDTITFEPDHFYAYAMCYKDFEDTITNVDTYDPNGTTYDPNDPNASGENIEETTYDPYADTTVEDVSTEGDANPDYLTDPSLIHGVQDSQTTTSEVHSTSESETTGTSQQMIIEDKPPAKIQSGKGSAIKKSNGSTVPTINL
jgi:hypothetical protein